jgi:hypothetical protein
MDLSQEILKSVVDTKRYIPSLSCMYVLKGGMVDLIYVNGNKYSLVDSCRVTKVDVDYFSLSSTYSVFHSVYTPKTVTGTVTIAKKSDLVGFGNYYEFWEDVEETFKYQDYGKEWFLRYRV